LMRLAKKMTVSCKSAMNNSDSEVSVIVCLALFVWKNAHRAGQIFRRKE
jgi:hypothetical protein